LTELKGKKVLFPDNEEFYHEFIANSTPSQKSASRQPSNRELNENDYESSQNTEKNQTSILPSKRYDSDKSKASPKPPKPPSKRGSDNTSIDEKNREVDTDLAKKISQTANNITEAIMS